MILVTCSLKITAMFVVCVIMILCFVPRATHLVLYESFMHLWYCVDDGSDNSDGDVGDV